MSNKVKKIVKDNWKLIAVGAVCITVTYVVTRRVMLQSMFTDVEGPTIDFFDPPTKNLVEVHFPKIFNGMQGNAVYNPSTRIGWFNQALAARAHGVSDSVLSDHILRNNPPDINGDVLERARIRIFVETE